MTERPEDKVVAGTPSLHSIDKAVAVLQSQLDGFVKAIEKRLDTVDTTIKESLGKYVTHDDLKSRDEAIADIRRNLTWGVRLVISAVILAVLGVVFKSGLLHG